MKPTPDWVKQLKPSGVQGHELLKAERANSNVPVQELEVLLHTQDVIDRRNKILDILKSEKVFDKSQNYFMGRIDRFERALAREKRLRILKKQHNWSFEEFRAATELVGEPGPYGLHDSMFKVPVTAHLHIAFTNDSGYTRGPGYTGTTREVAYQSQRLQDHRMLCPN
jgi:acyl-CoA oxidase